MSKQSEATRAWRRRLSHATERRTLIVGAGVYVTSRRGWATEAIIAGVTAARFGRMRYVCEYPTLGDVNAGAGLRTRRTEQVIVAPRHLIAWPGATW